MKSVLDSRQLLAASILARTGSFTLAGQQLSLTQSAVSHAIKALEEEVDCKLFTRTGRGVIVTEAGKYFLRYIEKILDEMETARSLIAPRIIRGKERLRLGASFRARDQFLPEVIPVFEQEYSTKLVVVEPGDFIKNLELLQSGLLDLVFSVKPVGRPEFNFVNLFEDELRFVVGPDHPWAVTGRASKKDLAGNSLVIHLKINSTPEILADYFRLEKITIRHRVEVAECDAIKQIAKSNSAVGVLPPWLVSKELNEGSLVSIPMGDRLLIRQWGLVYVPQRPLAAIDLRFIELCRLAVPAILNRLQSSSRGSYEKKEISVEAAAEGKNKHGWVSLLLFLTGSFFGEAVSWSI